jgi:hypothetical protein
MRNKATYDDMAADLLAALRAAVRRRLSDGMAPDAAVNAAVAALAAYADDLQGAAEAIDDAARGEEASAVTLH